MGRRTTLFVSRDRAHSRGMPSNATLKRVFHQMNRGMVPLWRLGLGRFMNIWPHGFGRMLVIEHVGRRSGRPYRTPVNFTYAGRDVHCVAGFGAHTDWYRNIMANPDIAVWPPDGRWTAVATDISDHPDRLDLIKAVLVDTGFASYVAGIDPRRFNADRLALATSAYRLVRLRPHHKSPSPDGPGSLAGVWLPVALMGFVLARLGHRMSP